MNKCTTIGLDLAKRIFHFVVLDETNKKIGAYKVMREDLIAKLLEIAPPGTLIAMEACSGANYWGRVLMCNGFGVKLLKTLDVKAYAKTRQKNDTNDALSIAKTALDPDIRPVSIKCEDAQTTLMVHSLREETKKERIQKSNALMAYLHEWGYVTPTGEKRFAQNAQMHVQKAFDEKFLGAMMAELLMEQAKELEVLLKKEANLERKIILLNKACQLTNRLMTIPGIGHIVGSALSCLNMQAYPTSRDFSASLGLVPKQYTTGGNVQLGSITKTGNRYVRTMLIQGARCALMQAMKLEKKGACIVDPLMIWGMQLFKRKGFNIACVAMANKMARIVFVLAQNLEAVYNAQHSKIGSPINSNRASNTALSETFDLKKPKKARGKKAKIPLQEDLQKEKSQEVRKPKSLQKSA